MRRGKITITKKSTRRPIGSKAGKSLQSKTIDKPVANKPAKTTSNHEKLVEDELTMCKYGVKEESLNQQETIGRDIQNDG